ncbi:glycosyltransferase family 2 protein [Paraburkholderia aspalathi]|uniref:glycosyltransferase family 2 protein n=1 Tax=Paraburkholderia aspalathi TaxID=1324617 RepID=UPI0038BD7B23
MRWNSLIESPRRFWRGFHEAIQIRGGVLPVARRVIDVVRREGPSGLRSLMYRAANAGDYGGWVERFDSIDEGTRSVLRARSAALADRPLISILVPVFNTPADYLREMIESVRAQIYQEWELCVCDDASTLPHVAAILKEYATLDARIRVVRRATNGHICVASNDALTIATGRFVALVDHDDRLPEHALYMVARYLQTHPSARMLYSDEDKLTPSGERVEPYFKSGWDPVLMLGQNMFSHLGVFETALLREVGGFRVGFEGSQDHDLVLRCSERVSSDEIVHIPHILYHWRSTAQSTARDVSAKPYVREATVRGVREHLERTGRQAVVEPLSANSAMVRVKFAIPQPEEPLVSVIIPTRDKPDLLAKCISSLLDRTNYRNFEILIVDNGSADARALALLADYAKIPNVTVFRVDAPFNYSALNNEAAAHAQGTLLCLLNNDIEVIDPDWMSILCGYALQPGAGAIGAALWYPNDTLQHGGVILAGDSIAGHMHHLLHRGGSGYFGRAMLAQQVSAVSAACLLVRHDLFDAVGGLDAENLTVAYNDVDFCLKLHAAGYRNVYVPYANLYHYESASRGNDATGERARRLAREAGWMQSRWGDALSCDAFYNPNLAVTGGKFFSLASPPRVGQFD